MTIQYLERDGKPRIAYRILEAGEGGKGLPTVVFCGGFRSDMEGTKAQFIEDCCKKRGQAYVRFDYSGHGSSDGEFDEGTIGSWTEDTLAVIDTVTSGPVLIVGSSMGGWVSLLAALARPSRIKAFVGIAAAPDFTREIYEDEFDDQARGLLQEQGYVDVPSEYSDEPYRITKALIDDGTRQCLLDGLIDLKIPMRLLQGMQDTDVPWQKAYRIKKALPDEELAEVLLIESGDHRLSRPEDLALLDEQIIELSGVAS